MVDHEKLRVIAAAIVPVPDHYVLEMEDSVPQGEERERCFIWEDPEDRDGQIEIALDLTTGMLTRLEISRGARDEAKDDQAALRSVEDARRVADEFAAKHAPDAAEYTSVDVKEYESGIRITYREEAGGLPLPGTGCEVSLDRALHVVRYRLRGRKNGEVPKPVWPNAIADEETVLRRIRSQLRMEPAIVTLHPSLYEMAGSEPEFRLVYEPIPDRPWIDAMTGRDRFSQEHYVMPPSRPLQADRSDAAPASSEAMSLSWESLLGIDPARYACVKSDDDGERMKRLYALKDQQEDEPEAERLSADGYLERRWGDKLRDLRDSALMVQVEKATGRLIGFHRMGSGKEGRPSLSRSQCWDKAEQLLSCIFPEYKQYLQLEMDREASEDEPREREFFYLPVYIDGIPVNQERVTISVSTVNGDICTYIGVTYAMIQELSARRFVPELTPEAAYDRYVQHLRLRLQWFLDDDQDVPCYRLLYVPQTDDNRKRTLRYIDAVTGELIWGK